MTDRRSAIRNSGFVNRDVLLSNRCMFFLDSNYIYPYLKGILTSFGQLIERYAALNMLLNLVSNAHLT